MPSDGTHHVPRYEAAAAAMAELRDDYEPSTRNEAQTRFEILDRLLLDILGWQRDHVVVEKRLDSAFTDYELRIEATQVILEAKREGQWFSLPPGSSERFRSLKVLTNEIPELAEAVRQVTDYCQDRGVPIGVVANGNHLVAFMATRVDGVPPLEGRALVYDSLESMATDFRPLWDALSPAGVGANRLSTLLREGAQLPPPQKLSARIRDYPGFQRRNLQQQRLQTLGELFIEDLYQEGDSLEEFLQECYCSSGALSQYAMVSKDILRARYSSLLEDELQTTVEPASVKDGLSPELQEDLLGAAFSRRPIVLLGDVGAGKTIFIKNLMHVEAKETIDRSIAIYIDLGTDPTRTDALVDHVEAEISRQLLDKYDIDILSDGFVRGVYHGQLERFREGPWGRLQETDEAAFVRKEVEYLEKLVDNTDGHIQASLTHLSAGERRNIIIFLDNVDQRDIGLQEEAFLYAQHVAARWPATIFVSLRPETYNASRRSGVLDAYEPRVFAIAPPRVDRVISTRLEFACKKIQEQGQLTLLRAPGVSFRSENLEAVLRTLYSSFDENEELGAMVDNLSGGNIRRALRWIQTFVGSGHVNTAKIIQIYEEDGRYTVPTFEFLRALMYGDAKYYDPSSSPIRNVFDVSSRDAREHFLVPIVIAVTERLGSTGSEQGFVPIEEIYQHAQALGFTAQQVSLGVNRAIEGELAERSPRSPEEDLSHLRLTTIGAYSVHELPKQFAYLDAVVVDIPIIDEAARDQIALVTNFEERLERTDALREYLDSVWRRLPEASDIFGWPAISAELESDLDRARRSQKRNA